VKADWLTEADESIKLIQTLRAEGKPAIDATKEAAKLFESTGVKMDAWDAFAPDWLRSAAGSLAKIKVLSGILTGLGVVADAGTVISPQDTGALGVVDRGAATVNGALLVLNATTDWVPGWGEAVIAVTGAYLAGDFLYHQRALLGDAAHDIGHAVVTSAERSVEEGVATAKEAGHVAASAWHSVTSAIGSWI
jgi:hypothetical protein